MPGHARLIETTILAGALGIHQTAFGLRDRTPKLLCRFNPFLDNDLYVGKSLFGMSRRPPHSREVQALRQ